MTYFGQSTIGRREHSGDPIALGRQRRTPCLRGDVFRVVLPKTRLELLAHPGTPAHLARIRHEQDRTHYAVFKRPTIPVVVIGAGESDAVLIAQVRHERDGSRV